MMINSRTSSLYRSNLSNFVGLVVLFVSLSSSDSRGCLGFVHRTTGLSRYSNTPESSYSGKDMRSTPSTTTTTTTTMHAATISTEVEAEVLTAMAHITMDFTGLAKPSKSLIRLFVVIGRMLVISADYVADHSIHPEELLIQLFLMSVAIKEMIVSEDDDTNEDDATKR
mmetsp:Transcript_20049/g.22372  ORF Transcript_20049/g.22372 Transcript_20049/m.22372 type:complete len:169 (+) Transcript_20049:173-679(+)